MTFVRRHRRTTQARRPQAVGPFSSPAWPWRLAFTRWPKRRRNARMPRVRPESGPGGVEMNKRFVVAWVVLFVLWMLEGMVVHGMLLGGDYKALGPLFRPEADAQGYFGWMIAAHVVLSGAFVWVYERGI